MKGANRTKLLINLLIFVGSVRVCQLCVFHVFAFPVCTFRVCHFFQFCQAFLCAYHGSLCAEVGPRVVCHRRLSEPFSCPKDVNHRQETNSYWLCWDIHPGMFE